MSKIIFNKILSKLERLDKYLQYLAEIQKVNKKSFVNDYHFYGLAERYLQLAIETALDIGKLIILIEKLRRPEDNQDIFITLGEKSILPKKLTERFMGIANFRNILVHDYEKIDHEMVYKNLHERLGDFKDFKKAILRFAKRKF